MYCVKVTQSCSTLCDPMDCQGFSVHGILQARRLEWVAVPFSRASFQPRGQTQVSCRWILYRLSHQGTCTTYVFGIFIQCAHTFFFFFTLFNGMFSFSQESIFFDHTIHILVIYILQGNFPTHHHGEECYKVK